MIKLGNEHEVDCRCGIKAVCREVGVHTDHEFRRIAYSCHADCVLDPKHQSKLREVHEFFHKLDNLMRECNKNLPALKKGKIVKIDFSYELPHACEKFSKVRILAEIRGFAQETELVLDPVLLNSLTVEKTTRIVADASKPYMDGFESNFKAGKF